MRLIGFIFACIAVLSSFGQSEPKLETVIQKGHVKYVSCSAFSPDGKYIVTGSLDHTIKLWNISNGKEIRSFNYHTDKIFSVSFSPDGKYILSASSDNSAIIFNVLTGESKMDFKQKDLTKAVFSPQGNYVLTQDNRNKTILWDANTGKKKGDYKKDYTGSIQSGWFSPDEKKLMSYNNYKQTNVIPLSTEEDSLQLNFDKAYSFSFSKNGKYIAIGSSKLFAEIFDANSGKLLHHLKADEAIKCDGCKTKISFSDDSKYLATTSNKEDVSIWNVSSGKLMYQLKDTKDKADYLTFSPNGKYLLIKDDKKVIVYDVKNNKELFSVKSNYIRYCYPEFSPNSRYVLVPDENNICVMWDIVSGKKIQTFRGYLNQNRNDGLTYSYTNWTHTSILKYLSMKQNINISPDGKYFVKGNIDSVAILVDIGTGKMVRTFEGHKKAVLSMDFSQDGKTLLTAGGDGMLKLWDVALGKELKSISAHRELIFDAKFSHDDQMIVSGSWDGSTRIWSVNTGEQLQYINHESNSAYTVNFTPNDLYLVTGDLDKNVKYWEVDAGMEYRNLIGHTNVVSSIDFSPDAQTIVSGSWDGKVKLWQVSNGMLIGKMKHQAGVNTVCFDPRGKFIASGGSDREIKIWDSKNNKILYTLKGHSSPVSSIQISPDSKKLLSCSVDGVVKVWDLITFKEIYTYIQVGRRDWLTTIPQGYFDGTSLALKYINYVSGMESVPVGSLFKKYHTPGLIKQVFEGNVFGEAKDIYEVISSSPSVHTQLLDVNDHLINISNDSTLELSNNTVKLQVQIASNGVDLLESRIYNNGKLIQYESIDNTKKTQTQTFDIELVNGRNKISSVVLNAKMVESEPSTIEVVHYGEGTLANLHILSIGINNYKNSNYQLNYALNDANSYTKLVRKGAKSLFDQVHEYFLEDDKANKERIKNTMQEIAAVAKPEDVFLFYYAGHGVMSESEHNEEDFYIITHDVTNIYANPEELKLKAISAAELMEYSMQIKAEKQLFVLDACHSGGALQSFAKRGVAREKAISQLARSTGTVFLTASQDAQYANEESKLQHGLFTYAIIEALEGKADSGRKDEKITVNELKTYVEDRVPELSEKYEVPSQYPTGYSFGQDFPIVIVK